MTTKNNITDAITDRLNKARIARGSFQKALSQITNRDVDTGLRLNYYKALILTILLYSVHIHHITDQTLNKPQSFHSHCIHYIIHAKYDNNQKRDANLQIRRKYSLPTIKSIIHQRYIKQIYNWRNAMSFAYLNKDKINRDLEEFHNELRFVKNAISSNIPCTCRNFHACETHNIFHDRLQNTNANRKYIAVLTTCAMNKSKLRKPNIFKK